MTQDHLTIKGNFAGTSQACTWPGSIDKKCQKTLYCCDNSRFAFTWPDQWGFLGGVDHLCSCFAYTASLTKNLQIITPDISRFI